MTDSLFGDADLPREPRQLWAGVVHVPDWLSMRQQRWLVAKFHEWGRGPVPPHSPLINGHPMSVRTTSLGAAWDEFGLHDLAPTGEQPLPVPDWLVRAGQQALVAAYSPELATDWPGLDRAGLEAWARDYVPDVAVVNYYSPTARMGMHQDKDERSSAPVVSFSVGDTAIFRAGNTETKNRPWEDLRLASGDLVVFGGPSRFMHHGVPKILPGTAPAECGVPEGRINITLRMSGR